MEIHHVLPKSKGGKANNSIKLCSICHDILHYIIDIEDIDKFNTISKIRNIPELKKYLDWISKQKDGVIYKIKKILKLSLTLVLR